MKEYKKQWKNHEFAPCYLFFGAEAFLCREYETALTQAILPTGTEMMNQDTFVEKQATAAAIQDAAETLPFLHDKRLVTVRNSEFFLKNGRKEEGERLKAFLGELPESTCLLFVEEKVEKTSALYKAVVKYGQVLEFQKPKEKDLVLWVKRRCRLKGLLLSDGMIDLFLRTVDHDMENIERELEKLRAYQQEGEPIRPEDIQALCTVSLEARVFDLVKAVAEKKAEQAMQMYRNLMQKRESPYMVLSLITRQFRLILETMLLTQSGKTMLEIEELLEIRSFAVREYLRQSKRFSPDGWKKALQDCLATDMDIKSGRMGEETAVELLLLRCSSL